MVSQYGLGQYVPNDLVLLNGFVLGELWWLEHEIDQCIFAYEQLLAVAFRMQIVAVEGALPAALQSWSNYLCNGLAFDFLHVRYVERCYREILCHEK